MSENGSIDALWEPIRINGLEIRNRVFVSAHTMGFVDGEPIVGDRLINYVAERARGGAGLVMSAADSVHPSGWHPRQLQAWREDAGPRYRKLAERVAEHGAAVFAQIYHLGVQTTGTVVLEMEHPVLGPSGLPSPVYGRIPKALELAEIREIVQGFGRSAEIIRASGVHGIEINGAHGYLVSGFLSAFNNQRQDEYGGSVENRCRFVVEAGAEIRRRVGADYPLGLRMNFEEFAGPGGFEPAQAEQLLAEIHRHRIFDYFNISSGSYHAQWGLIVPGTSPLEAPNVPNAARAKKVVGNEVPVLVANKLYTLEQAAGVIRGGHADMVAMTRAHIADPQLVRKAREGRAGEIRRCVGFNQGCVGRAAWGMSSCTVNPAAGREATLGGEPAQAGSPRRITVVGGGPAGLRFAEEAARRGHRVRLLEREEELGGQLRYAGRLPRRERWLDLVEDLAGAVRRLGVHVELGHQASARELRQDEADLIVLATGSRFDTSGLSVFRQDRRAIPGAGRPGVIDPVAAIGGADAGQSVVIVDDYGDHAALGVAQLLGESGKEVHLVTGGPMVGQPLTNTFEVPEVLYPQLLAAGVKFHVWTTVDSIEPDHVVLRDVWTGEVTRVAARTVVMNTHRVPEDALYTEIADLGPRLRRIGDCVAPRQVDDAIFEAVDLAVGLGQPAQAGAARFFSAEA